MATDDVTNNEESSCSLSDIKEPVPGKSECLQDLLFQSTCEQEEQEQREQEQKQINEDMETLSYIGLCFVVYAINRHAELLDVRNEILKSDNNNLFRAYMKELTAKKKSEKENWDLEKTIDWYKKNFVPNEEVLKTFEELRRVKKSEFDLIQRVMVAEGDAEQKEQMLEIFEKYFGGRNKLYKLNSVMETCTDKGRKCRQKYDFVDELIAEHTGEKCSKTLGQRIVGCVEKVTDCYIGMLRGIYRRLMGTDYKERKNSK